MVEKRIGPDGKPLRSKAKKAPKGTDVSQQQAHPPGGVSRECGEKATIPVVPDVWGDVNSNKRKASMQLDPVTIRAKKPRLGVAPMKGRRTMRALRRLADQDGYLLRSNSQPTYYGLTIPLSYIGRSRWVFAG